MHDLTVIESGRFIKLGARKTKLRAMFFPQVKQGFRWRSCLMKGFN